MANWTTDNPWEDELPDDLPPEERWEFSIAQVADGTAEPPAAEALRSEPIAQQMVDRYMRLDALLRQEASKPISGIDWDQTAEQIERHVLAGQPEERDLLLGTPATRERSFWATFGWVKPAAGALAAAAAVAVLLVTVRPAPTPTPLPSVATVEPQATSGAEDDVEAASSVPPVLMVEVPTVPNSATLQGRVEVEVVPSPDFAGVIWENPLVTGSREGQGASSREPVFIGPVER